MPQTFPIERFTHSKLAAYHALLDHQTIHVNIIHCATNWGRKCIYSGCSVCVLYVPHLYSLLTLNMNSEANSLPADVTGFPSVDSHPDDTTLLDLNATEPRLEHKLETPPTSIIQNVPTTPHKGTPGTLRVDKDKAAYKALQAEQMEDPQVTQLPYAQFLAMCVPGETIKISDKLEADCRTVFNSAASGKRENQVGREEELYPGIVSLFFSSVG